ncbi:PH domain-containing protein [Paucilactobacillus sp. N302-9]
MAKTCAICGDKIKMLDSDSVNLQDGFIDGKCALKAGIKGAFASVDWGTSHTVADVQKILDSGKPIDIKAENQQAKLQKKEQKKQDIIEKTASNEAKLKIINQQFIDAGVSDLFGTRKEVNALPDILADDEVVKYATSGIVDANTILMVCTDTRILFIDKGLVYGIKSTEIPLDMVNSVNYSKGMLFGDISIVNGAVTTKVENVNKATAPIMVDAVKQARTDFMNKKQQPAQPQPVQSQTSVVDELRELKGLVDEGILTQEEFDAKKKQILGI